MKIGQKLFTGAPKRILIHYGLGTQFLVSEFECIQTALRIMKLTYNFAMVKNMQTIEYGMNNIHDLSTGQHKRLQIYEEL